MGHGFNEQQWLSYIEGTLDGAERRLLEEHLAVCQECAAETVQQRRWHDQLRQEGLKLSAALQAHQDAADFEWLMRRSLDSLRGDRPAWTVREGLSLLRFVMEPICGSGATRAAMNLAIKRSAGEENALSETNWGLFIGNLREATTLVCGLATGRLISRAGSCMVIGG